MAKSPTLNDIAANGFEAISTYNANQDAIETAFANTISRDGSTPNSMEANLDLNSYRIINLLDPVANQDAASKLYVDTLALGSVDISLVNGIKYVSSYSALTALTGSTGLVDGGAYIVKGVITDRRGVEGLFIYDATSTATADGGTILAIDGGGAGRFYRKDVNIINVKHFGALGDFSNDDGAAINSAVASARNALNNGATIIYFPDGKYKSSVTIPITAVSSVHGLSLIGSGKSSAQIDFTGAASGTDGITVTGGVSFTIKGLDIRNAPQDNLVLGYGNTVMGATYLRYYNVEDVNLFNAGRDNVRTINTYMGTYTNVWSSYANRHGFNFEGFHTTLTVKNCHATDAVEKGFALNGLSACTFITCHSDRNEFAYYSTNLNGVAFIGCGAESTEKDAYSFIASDAVAGSIAANAQDIRGVTMVGCNCSDNSTASRGTYGAVTLSASNSRRVDVNISGGLFWSGSSSEIVFKITTASSGTIELIEENLQKRNTYAADSITGTGHLHINKSVQGKRCLLQTTGTGQSISTATNTTLNWDTASPVANTLGATFSSTTGIVIPRGVHQVVVSTNVVYGNNATNKRQTTLLKNGSVVAELPTVVGQAFAYVGQFITSPPIPCVEGDIFSVRVYQDSGGALNMLNGPNNNFWFGVYAMG